VILLGYHVLAASRPRPVHLARVAIAVLVGALPVLVMTCRQSEMGGWVGKPAPREFASAALHLFGGFPATIGAYAVLIVAGILWWSQGRPKRPGLGSLAAVTGVAALTTPTLLLLASVLVKPVWTARYGLDAIPLAPIVLATFVQMPKTLQRTELRPAGVGTSGTVLSDLGAGRQE
jgi:hypothetical protein